jgi:hypothetical protein
MPPGSRAPALSLLTLAFFPLLSVTHLHAQGREYLAMVPPFHDRLGTPGAESSLQLVRQRFIIFVYRDAIAVYSDADFTNTGKEPVTQEFALPSTGHDENGPAAGGRISSGILSVQLWVAGERVVPQLVNDGDEDWYVIQTELEPGEQKKVKALFWAQTSLADLDSLPGLDTVMIAEGNRGFMVDLSHSSSWNGTIAALQVDVVLKEGLNLEQASFSADPDTYEVRDSSLVWELYDVEPSASDNIVVSYASYGNNGPANNTMARLSAFIVRTVYDELLDSVRSMDED